LRPIGRLRELIDALPISRRFGRDLVWNVVSVGILAFSGLVISLGIGRYYGPATLGLFNQTFAIYIVASQFAVCGLQLSVVKHTAQYVEENAETSNILAAAALLTALVGSSVSALLFSLKGVVAHILSSPDISISLTYAAPGVLLFAMNKVFLHYINGRRHMRAYAVFQSLRYIALLGGLAVFVLMRMPGVRLAALLPTAEALVSLLLACYVLRLATLPTVAGVRTWIVKHLRFGIRALPAGVLTDTNTRIDVLLLGVFASDYVVGVYSLASMFAQGLARLAYIMMVNVNPIVSKIFHGDQRERLGPMMRRGVRLSYVALGGTVAVAVALYPIILRLALHHADFAVSWALFGIIGAGIALASGYLPFLMVLNQTGHPVSYTLLLLGTGATRAALCLILIPLVGVYGAAAAAGASFLVSAVLLRAFVRCKLEICI
jgi:O-antigen/teichoic acid export membrane protein